VSAPLPHVCDACHAVETGGVWQRVEPFPPPPHSHGKCPACVAEYQRQLAALRPAPRRKSWAAKAGAAVFRATEAGK
jgi:NMD protein affecting ribosome stability and mRNA decay